ncbi:LacI family DNA-binding transcriptional regulator [Dactylosporangium sp. NPDC000244]|uniref:LacI family DNA-binding transcriptional regulator n=1 Tax=Dactylosporangium sp. NPDC000244 TaxID=3154365 RepID=UPI00331862D8
MPVTMAVVAARAGVSKATVSRVVNGAPGIDELTAARVRAVIQELGYVPSARAVGLARGRTGSVGILVPSLTWPWVGEVLQGVADVVESRGFGLLVFTFNQGPDSMRRFAAQLSGKAFDGLLVIEPSGTLDKIAELHDNGLPVVLIDDRGHEPRFPWVGTSNRMGARAAAEHLLAIGRTRPLIISGEPRFGCVRARLAGFQEPFQAAGVPLDPALTLEGDFTYASGIARAREALARGLAFDAVFAHNDVMAGAAMGVLREAGRRIPDDVAVVGFDDLPWTTQTEPPLTAVHQPVRRMGEVAAGALLDHLDGKRLTGDPIVLPTGFTVRESTVRPR